MNITGKKLFLIGFIVVLLVGIPVTVYLLQQQQETRSRAEKSTTISFLPESTETNPLQKSVGDTIDLDVNVDPGNNLVSFVKLQIQYDPEKLATASSDAFQPNTLVFPSVLEGPVYSPGKIEVTLSVGPDPTKAIQEVVKAATLKFTALADTPAGTPTLVKYGINTQVLSLGAQDQASENVLANALPAAIAIGSGGPTSAIPSGSPTPTIETPTATPTQAPDATPAPTSASSPTANPTPTSTSGGGGGTGSTIGPVCNSFVVDRETTGEPPFSITFTANGTDADDTVSKATFNFGDGQVSDVTTGGGIGTESVNVQISHTYQNEGTFTASVILTDASSNVSETANCSQTVTVTASDSAGTGGADTQPTSAQGTPTPTMEPTGPLGLTLGLGAAALFLIIAGGLVFFVL